MEEKGGTKLDKDENRRRPTRPGREDNQPWNSGSPLLRWPGRRINEVSCGENT